MSYEHICTWLDLPAGSWPPNHYVLLGLTPGESDVERIEQKVHDRLLRLRSYQLNHPDQASEAMNRLAQAFMCLTDAEAKKIYDASLSSPKHVEPATQPPPEASAGSSADPLAWLFGPANQAEPAPPEVFASAAVAEEPTAEATLRDWSKAPPPQRAAAEEAAPAETAASANGSEAAAVADTQPEERPALMSAPADPVLDRARCSRAARCGLGTRSGLFDRVMCTRELLYAWQQVGRFLGQPRRRLTRIAEANELIRRLSEIRELLEEFPPLLGQAGQPGYLVLALARQPMVVPTFRSLSRSQRVALARDWRAGKVMLEVHRRFLRDELKTVRCQSRVARMWRSVCAFLTEQGVALLLLALLVAANLLLWRFVFGRR